MEWDIEELYQNWRSKVGDETQEGDERGRHVELKLEDILL